MGLIKKYSEIVSSKPFLVLLICIIITMVFFYGATKTVTKTMQYSDLLPQNLEEIKAVNLIGDEFESSGSALTFVIEVDPSEINSNEARDIRDYRVAMYINELGEKISTIRNVMSVASYSTLLKTYNSNYIPKTNREINEIITNPNYKTNFESYLSSDYSMALIKVYLNEMNDAEKKELINDLDNVLEETKAPAGIKSNYTGDIKVSNKIQAMIGPTMSSTSIVSLAAILAIVCLLFWSIRKGVVSLFAILFGTVWVFGGLGFIGLGISSAMSGAVSMIMGVGIDFGIQIVNRFTQERKINSIEDSTINTLENTVPQMFVTTIAALIGFRAMALGQLTLLADMSTMMSLGILFCFIAAVMLIPPILVLNERFIESKKKRAIVKNEKKKNTKIR